MATVIEFSVSAGAEGVTFYGGGSVASSRVVGNDWKDDAVHRRVVRYAFTAPAEGASGISLVFNTQGLDDSCTYGDIPLRFFIGTSDSSHKNAGATAEYTGVLTLGSDGKTFTGEADILLMPNTTYYLWVFPANDNRYAWYGWYRSGYTNTFTLTGGAGVTYIDGEAYQSYIGNGTEYELFLPYGGNGSSFDLYSG